MLTDPAPFSCPSCGEERLVDGDPAAWFCQVCGQHGPPRLRLAPAVAQHAPARPSDSLAGQLAAIVNLHLPSDTVWQVAAIAPLTKWSGPVQRDLTTALGALTDPVLLVLERVPR